MGRAVLSGAVPPPAAVDAAASTQRPRSELEELVLGLEADLEAHMNDPAVWTSDWLCNRVTLVVEFHVTADDAKTYGKVATPEDRVFAVLQREPLRTQLKRIDVEVHDPRLRWRRRRQLFGPYLDRAARETIRDLAALVERKRRVSA